LRSAGSCVEANTASTAAIVLGDAGDAWLEAMGLPARLVSRRGRVVRLGGWPEPQQIPTLWEVLNLAKDHVQVYIEIKFSERDGVFGRYPNIAEAVVEAVRSAGMLAQVLIISFDWTILPIIKSLEPALQTGTIVSDDVWNPRAEHALQTLVDELASLRCNWINMDCDLFTNTMPGVAHNHGYKLGIWTVNSSDEMRRLATAGIDSITTDRPDLFYEVKL